MKRVFESLRGKLVAILVAIIATFIYLAFPQLLYNTAEHKVYDALLSAAQSDVIEERVVIVDIDERSLARHGAWPWPRALVARTVNELIERHKVTLLGLDIFFPEARDGDRELRAALNRPNVVLSETLDFAPDSINRVGTPAHSVALAGREFAPRASGYIANDARLLPRPANVGHVSPLIDDDGRVRRIYPLACVERSCALTLSLRMYAQLTHGSNDLVRASYENSGRTLRVAPVDGEPVSVPLDPQRAWIIPYRIAPGGFSVVSAADVLDPAMSLPEIENGIVLLGSSALGIGDRVITPLAKLSPGVEVHAQLLAALLDRDFIAPVSPASWPFLLLAAFVLVSCLFWPQGGKRQLLWLVLALAVVGGLLTWLLLQRGLWLPLTPLPLMIFVLVLVSMLQQNFTLSERMGRLRVQLNQFLPASLAGRVLHDAKVGPETARHTMTVLIVDVRGFTAASEGKTPEQIAEFAQKCFELLSTEVARYRGTIEKYTGDGLMALWGVPTDDGRSQARGRSGEAPLYVHPAEHAQHGGQDVAHARYAAQAVSAGLAMQRAMASTSDWFAERGYGQVGLSIGLNTGPMSVGVYGGAAHLAWSAQGQAFNIASRIESLTRELGHNLLMGEATALLIAPQSLQKLGEYQVKGVAEKIPVYGVNAEFNNI